MRETSLHRPIDPPPGSLRHPPRHCRVPGITSSVRWGSMPNRARLFAQPEKTARQEDDRDELLCLRCCVYGERAIGIRSVCSGRLHWHIRARDLMGWQTANLEQLPKRLPRWGAS